jgi:hypothetical protein
MCLDFCSFVDRDMAMRYHWGFAVGHIYTHDLQSEEQNGADPGRRLGLGKDSDSDSPDLDPTAYDDSLDAQVLINGVEEFEVESILDSRIRQRHLEYLVHWKGYSHEDDTWEPEVNVENCAGLIRQFHRECPSAPHGAGLETLQYTESEEADSDDSGQSVGDDESQTTGDSDGEDGLSILELHEMYGFSQDYEVYE